MSEANNKKKIARNFGMSTWAVDNHITVFVLTAMITIFGLLAYNSMPRESFPEIVMPQIYVGTPYPGNSPADMEKLITRPLEKELNTVSDVDKITSTSIQGYSTILVEFDFSITPDEALRKVKDAVDKARTEPSFPDDLPAEPNIFEMNFSEFPILNINLAGDFSMETLREYGEYLEDEIEKVMEVSEVNIRGVQKKEVKINVDVHKMEALKISFNDISAAIANENMTISGGEVLTDNFRRTVRVVGDFQSMEDIEDVIVKQEFFNIVYLKDVATVEFDFEERSSYAREFGQPVVMLDVIKKSGENLLAAVDNIHTILEKAKKEKLPNNLEISITNDTSSQTKSMVSNLENSIISGIILVVLVLLFFLGLRNALFVGVAIPLSMFMSFMILGALGVTINMMVLYALILALGMLVDNGIVVVENIYRLMDEGMTPKQAAKEGVGEVAWPIIASTATTLAAFLPLALWPGMMGQFMQYLPITLIIVLGSSLFVGLVVNPVLTSIYMKVGEQVPNKKKVLKTAAILVGISVLFYVTGVFSIANLLTAGALIAVLNAFILSPAAKKFQNGFMPVLEERYERFLNFALHGKRPRFLFIGVNLLLIFSFIIMGLFTPRVLFFPVNMPKYVNIFIEKPIGTDIESTNQTAMQIEEIVREEMKKYEVEDSSGKKVNFLVESIIGNVGEGTSDPNEGPSMGNTPHKARVTVTFVDFEERNGVQTGDVMEEIRTAVKNKIPGIKISVDKDAAGPPVGPPINIEVIGEDIDELIDVAEKMRLFINSKHIAGIDELKLDVEIGKPELLVEIDRRKARRMNLSTGQIGQAIRTALYGAEISQYKDGEDDYPIQLRLADKYRYNSETLLNQKITFRDPSNGKIQQIPISSVAKPIKSSTYTAIKRKDLDRVVTVFSTVVEGYNPTEVVNSIKSELEQFENPDRVTIKFTGEQEEQAKEMAFLGRALLIAVFLIFLIIVAQFNSAVTPFIIVGSVVFSLIGVLLGLVIFQMDFVVIMTMIGIISLAGVVVNNAIVLIDYTNLIMDRKRNELGIEEGGLLPLPELINSIVQGGRTRLRPVLLTAITTVLGLIPLATGMNIDFFGMFSNFAPNIYFGGDNVVFWSPMSWTVIFGLTFATFLTLVIVPVMYLLYFKVSKKYAR